MVEIIARRVLGGISSGSSLAAPLAGGAQAKKYAWAWKAVGAADLVRFPLADEFRSLTLLVTRSQRRNIQHP